jgi:outer membrane protein OmpA-like peptidoglycan-associated protein
MSRKLNTVGAAACILAAFTSVLLARDEPPEEKSKAYLREPQNAPRTLKADVRTLVGLGQGVKGAHVTLQADVTGLEKTMNDLGAQVKNGEIHIDLPGDVLFDFDKTELKPAAQNVLKKLAAIIRAKSKGVVQIDGYTDSKGSDPYNQRLSEVRAESVKKWLTTNGDVSAVGLQTKGFGKANPIASNTRTDGSDNPEGRARNRRVEVIISTH